MAGSSQPIPVKVDNWGTIGLEGNLTTKTILATLLAAAVFAADPPDILGPYSSGTNFSADIKGTPDTRPRTWGTAGEFIFPIKFSPPPGYRVRILRAYGDFLVWPKGVVVKGRFAGALFGLQTTAPEGSVRADWLADNTFLYIQTATGGERAREQFDFPVDVGGLLERDNMLRVKVAVWLNDTGLEIHCEPSFVLTFSFEREENLEETSDYTCRPYRLRLGASTVNP